MGGALQEVEGGLPSLKEVIKSIEVVGLEVTMASE